MPKVDDDSEPCLALYLDMPEELRQHLDKSLDGLLRQQGGEGSNLLRRNFRPALGFPALENMARLSLEGGRDLLLTERREERPSFPMGEAVRGTEPLVWDHRPFDQLLGNEDDDEILDQNWLEEYEQDMGEEEERVLPRPRSTGKTAPAPPPGRI